MHGFQTGLSAELPNLYGSSLRYQGSGRDVSCGQVIKREAFLFQSVRLHKSMSAGDKMLRRLHLLFCRIYQTEHR